MMETSVEAAEVLVTPQPDEASSPAPEAPEAEAAGAPRAAASCPGGLDPMEEFSQRLDDIIQTYGSTAGLLTEQGVVPAEVNDQVADDITGSVETEVLLIVRSLDELSSPEEKLGALVRKYAELAALRRRDGLKLEERLQLQAERRGSIAARSELETLCREQQAFYKVLREETLQRCKEDEEKRTEITTHFQSMLTEIQSQIELHSTRNEKLCHENINLTDKLENLMTQCERREESLEKINKHRDLQQKLIEAKLQQANALLAEAEDKHRREKEYLLREAIDKTKKCFAMKEQELAMKKKLTLYGQKFDEFQATLAKSNEIYVRFKKEMENMSDKMKKVERESDLWKTRFENCNKALTDMMEERTEKGKEYDLFVLKILKLEKLCRALQEERKVLYDKIKEIRCSNGSLPAKVCGGSDLDGKPEGAEEPAPDELKEMEEEDQVLTDGMARLKEEQAKLQEFAASLLVTAIDEEEENNTLDLDEDLVSSALFHFKTKPQAKEVLDSVPEQVSDSKSKEADSELPQPVKVDELQDQVTPAGEAPSSQETTLETSSEPNAEVVQTQVQPEEVQQVKQPVAPEPEPEQDKSETTAEVPVKDEKDQQQPIKHAADPERATCEPQSDEGQPGAPLQGQQPVEPAPTAGTEKTEDAEQLKITEVRPAVSVDDEKVQKLKAEAAPAASPPEAAADSSKKQLPKKKKKKSSMS